MFLMSAAGFRKRFTLSADCRSTKRICYDLLYNLWPNSWSTVASLQLTWRLLTDFSRNDMEFVPRLFFWLTDVLLHVHSFVLHHVICSVNTIWGQICSTWPTMSVQLPSYRNLGGNCVTYNKHPMQFLVANHREQCVDFQAPLSLSNHHHYAREPRREWVSE